MVSFLFCLSPLSSSAQVTWNGNVTLSPGQIINESIILTGDVYITVNSGEATINGVISGDVYWIDKKGSGKLILNAENTYTGGTYISEGTLALTYSGKIENSSRVVFSGPNAIFDISAGQKQIKALLSTYATAEVKLTSYPAPCGALEIGINGQNTLDSYFAGKFSGPGSFTKSGPNTLTLTGVSTNEGYYTYLQEGTIIFNSLANFGNTVVRFYNYSTSSPTTLKWADGNIADMSNKISYSESNYYGAEAILDVGNNNVVFSNAYDGFQYGIFVKKGSGKLTIAGSFTNQRQWTVAEGTLQIGNGSTGNLSFYGSSPAALTVNSGATLRFEPGTNTTFGPKITGAGNVQFKGDINKELTLGYSSFTGTTNIETGSTLKLNTGNQGTTTINSGSTLNLSSGSGSIINNGSCNFSGNNDYTFSGVISGGGGITKSGTGTLTFTGENTYSGATNITGGTLEIGNNGTSGSIDYTSGVSISSGATLSFNKTSSMVFSKNISGQGNVEKWRSGTLSLTGNNTTNGELRFFMGTLKFSHWAGDYYQNGGYVGGSILDVAGNVTIGGNIKFMQGTIKMDLNTSPPSKITANGEFIGPYVTTLDITSSGAVTNQPIIEAHSGIEISSFNLIIPGYNGTLSTNGSQLLLTTVLKDVIPPVPGNNGIITGTTSSNEAQLSWTPATDNQTSQNELRYYIYRSLSDNISTVNNCETYGTLISDGIPGITSCSVKDLSPNKTYYFNVVVADLENNKAAYVSKSLTTTKETQEAPPAPTATTITATSITLKTMTGCEYRISGGNWQKSTIFTGLESNTTYAFEAYKPETNTHFASLTSPFAYITTKEGADDPQVLGIEISPKTATVPPGQTKQFSATVMAIGGADKSVIWSITGNSSTLTSISPTGLLTVGNNEIAKTITVKVASNFDATFFDKATVTIGNVGIESITNDELQITVYPNPTTGKFNVQSSMFKVQSVEIFDVFGRKIYDDNNSYGLTVLRSYDLTVFPAGIYFLKITTENGIVTKKVIKN